MAEAKKKNMVKRTHDKSHYWVVAILANLLIWFLLFIFMYVYLDSTSEQIKLSVVGNYMAGVAGILNVIAFVGLTIVIHTIQKEQTEKNSQFQAEKLIIHKLQSQQEKFNEQLVAFRKDGSKEVAADSFELTQPLLIYFHYLKGLYFLNDWTKEVIEDTRQYLFQASCVFDTYANNSGEKNAKEITKVITTHIEINRRLGLLEVSMLTDVAKTADYGVFITVGTEDKMDQDSPKNEQ